MRGKKTILILFLSGLFALFLFGYAYPQIWPWFAVEQDRVVNDHELTIESLDDNLVILHKSVAFTHHHNNYELQFDYVIDTHNEPVILPKFDHKPGRNYQALKLPSHARFILEHANSLYDLDLENAVITNLISNNVKDYDYDTTMQKGLESELHITWGASPSLSPDGNKLLFFTNRNYIYGEHQAELWIKDLITKEEEPVYQSEYMREILGWKDDNHALIDILHGIIQLDIRNGDVEVLIEKNIQDAKFSFPHLVAQHEEGLLNILNVQTNESKQVKHENLGSVKAIAMNNNSNDFLIINAPERTESSRTIMIVNSVSGEIKTIEMPDALTIEYVEWVSPTDFIITVSEHGTKKFKTLLAQPQKKVERE